MLQTDTDIYVATNDRPEQRVLYPARVVLVSDETLGVEIEGYDLPIDVEQTVHIYYEIKQKFVQQQATVQIVSETESGLSIGIRVNGEPVSGESRQCYRVSTVISSMIATIDSNPCQLLEVSATGFAVTALEGAPYEAGRVVDVTMQHDGTVYGGRACVKSVRTMKHGRTRIGFCCADNRQGGSLPKALQLISMSVQRQHLRRLSGTG